MVFEAKNTYYGTEEQIDELSIQDQIDRKKLDITQLTKANLKELRVDILHKNSHLRVRDENGKIIGKLKDNQVVDFNGEKKLVKYKNTQKVFLGINYKKGDKIIKAFISADYVKDNITKTETSNKPTPKIKLTPKPIPKKEEEIDSPENTPDNNQTVIVENNNQNLAIEANKKVDSKVFSFSSPEELSKKIDELLESKLGAELSKKLKEKIKLLQNAQLFSNYMKIYASQNNDQDLGVFNFGSNYHDDKPIFIKGAVFFDYTRKINNLIKKGINGNKHQVENLLNTIDIKKDIKDISGQLITKYKWMPDMENPLDSNSEIEEIYNLIKEGDQIKIAHYFAEKFKDNSFISSSIVNNVNLKGLNLNIITDRNIEEATLEAYNKIHFNFNIFGKSLKFPKKGLSKSDVRELLEETRKDTSSMSKNQRQRYIYGLLVAKQINSLKEYLLSDESKLSLEEKEKLKLYYNDTNSWTEFKQHWKSTIMKGAVIAGTMIITDGLVAGMIPEGAAIGLGGARFAARIATMHNVSGDMSLLMNDQLTGKNALNVALDGKGYLHTAAYMGALEVFGAITGALGKTKFFEKMGGKLEKIGTGKFNLKNLSLYGVNVGGLLTIDMIGFDGEFTAEEIINVLVFASLMGRGNFKATKGADGKIDIKTWPKRIMEGFNKLKPKRAKVENISNPEILLPKNSKLEVTGKNGNQYEITTNDNGSIVKVFNKNKNIEIKGGAKSSWIKYNLENIRKKYGIETSETQTSSKQSQTEESTKTKEKETEKNNKKTEVNKDISDIQKEIDGNFNKAIETELNRLKANETINLNGNKITKIEDSLIKKRFKVEYNGKEYEFGSLKETKEFINSNIKDNVIKLEIISKSEYKEHNKKLDKLYKKETEIVDGYRFTKEGKIKNSKGEIIDFKKLPEKVKLKAVELTTGIKGISNNIIKSTDNLNNLIKKFGGKETITTGEVCDTIYSKSIKKGKKFFKTIGSENIINKLGNLEPQFIKNWTEKNRSLLNPMKYVNGVYMFTKGLGKFIINWGPNRTFENLGKSNTKMEVLKTILTGERTNKEALIAFTVMGALPIGMNIHEKGFIEALEWETFKDILLNEHGRILGPDTLNAINAGLIESGILSNITNSIKHWGQENVNNHPAINNQKTTINQNQSQEI